MDRDILWVPESICKPITVSETEILIICPSCKTIETFLQYLESLVIQLFELSGITEFGYSNEQLEVLAKGHM